MKKIIHLLMLLFALSGFAQKQWVEINENQISNLAKMDRASFPKSYKLFSLDFANLKSQLQLAPNADEGQLSSVVCFFPNADGDLVAYRMYETATLAPALAAKFTDIKTYSGQGIKNQSSTINISTTLFGLHAQILSVDNPTVLIDTYTKDNKNYIVYEKRSLVAAPRDYRCGAIGDSSENVITAETIPAARATDSKFRTYRLAMACTIEYAAYHVNAAGLNGGTLQQKKDAVLAAMTVTMVRVNGVYRREMSLQMQLVANNDQIIFIDTDNFSNDTASSLIDESQTQIDATIGDANYDIGHTVSTGGGGLAQKPSVCVTGKARGITGSPAPVGDAYDIDFVAHEMGHQFGADHTFAGDSGNCSGNRSSSFAVEPGSGSTIMAYAGICSPQDVQPNSNDYFSVVSLGQMFSHVTGAGNCQAGISNGNFPPVIPTLTNYTIPKGTPFILTAPQVTDANGDTLSYCWEQTNTFVNTTSSPIGASTATTGAIFRSYSPTSSLKRYFPILSSVLNNNLFPAYESLPSVARSLSFALTVRDNRNPNGGQTARANMTVTVTNAGPFNVTSQDTDGISWTQGSTETITWNVANTASIAGSSTVDILLSTDGGVNFNTVLASGVPNNGSTTITVPNVAFPFCRVMVKPTGNIFYDINSKQFAIGYNVSSSTVCINYPRTFSPARAIPTAWGAFGVPAPGVAITDNYIITDANFKMVCSAASTNQVSFGIIKPGSGIVDIVLFDGPTSTCSNTSTNLNAVFDDQGVNFDCAAPATGASYIPTQPLSDLNGLNSADTWRFAAKSSVAGNTMSSVIFTLCHVETTIILKTESFEFDNFSLAPNPNNGVFDIKFNSTSKDDIKIKIFDLRGRQIFNKSYQNIGLFNETLNLPNLIPGVYLVNIQDGDKKIVKKIIIQ